jgi:hypothetical protein
MVESPSMWMVGTVDAETDPIVDSSLALPAGVPSPAPPPHAARPLARTSVPIQADNKRLISSPFSSVDTA